MLFLDPDDPHLKDEDDEDDDDEPAASRCD
jgi:hypothetical protein